MAAVISCMGMVGPAMATQSAVVTGLPEAYQKQISDTQKLSGIGIEDYTDERNLLAAFDFDDVADGQTGQLDSSVGDAKATIEGQAAIVEGVDGTTAAELGSGFWLDVHRGDGSALLAGTHAVVISYDSKANQNTQGWSVYAAADDTAQTYMQERYLGVMDQTSTITVERYRNSGMRDTSANVSASSSSQWKHVDIVVTDERTTLYLDGVQRDESVNTSGVALTDILGTQGILQFGKANWVNGEYFTGAIDNVRIYDASAVAAYDAVSTSVPQTVREDFTLPVRADGLDVAWSSNNAAIVVDASIGKATVTRPAVGQSDVKVVLSATIDGQQFSYTVTVPHMESEAKKAQADLDAIVIAHADDVRGDVTLPMQGSVFGTEIHWVSSDPKIVSDSQIDGKAAGVVNRPQNRDVTVVMTATAGSAVRRIVLTVRQAVQAEETTDYLFAHFTGTEGSATDEQMYFATSQDGLSWTDLHSNGNPVLSSTVGEDGVRDPYLVRSPEGDRFYLIATDLSIYHRGGWGNGNPSVNGDGSMNLVVWESTDLIHWGEPRLVDVASKIPGAHMAWAPEAYWIPELDQYMVYWATTSSQDDHNPQAADPTNVYYSLTRDFVTFSTPVKWIDRPQSVIDTTMIRAEDGWYYRVSGDTYLGIERTKNPLAVTEVADGQGYIVDGSDDEWTFVGYFGDLVGNSNWTGALLEGPELFRYNMDDIQQTADGKPMPYGLMWDQYSVGAGYLPFRSADLGSVDTADWVQADNVNFGALKKRHGTILPITHAEYEAIVAAYGNDAEPDQQAPQPSHGALGVVDSNGRAVSELQLSQGQSVEVTAVGDSDVMNELRWSSSDMNIVSVIAGYSTVSHTVTVYAKGVGEASISVAFADGSGAVTIPVTVTGSTSSGSDEPGGTENAGDNTDKQGQQSEGNETGLATSGAQVSAMVLAAAACMAVAMGFVLSRVIRHRR